MLSESHDLLRTVSRCDAIERGNAPASLSAYFSFQPVYIFTINNITEWTMIRPAIRRRKDDRLGFSKRWSKGGQNIAPTHLSMQRWPHHGRGKRGAAIRAVVTFHLFKMAWNSEFDNLRGFTKSVGRRAQLPRL